MYIIIWKTNKIKITVQQTSISEHILSNKTDNLQAQCGACKFQAFGQISEHIQGACKFSSYVLAKVLANFATKQMGSTRGACKLLATLHFCEHMGLFATKSVLANERLFCSVEM